MEYTEEYYLSLIEKHFNLELSDSELKIVEEKLLMDSNFAKLYEQYKESRELVNNTFPSDASTKSYNDLENLIAKGDETEKSRFASWKNIFYVAAACISILIVGFLVIDSYSKPNIEVLSKNAWNKNIGLDYYTIRSSGSDSIKMTFLSAYESYKQRDYKQAISVLKSLNSNDLYYEDALLITGLSHHHLGNNTTAINKLQALRKFPTGKKANVARWYLGLIYLDENDLKEAGKYLIIPEKKYSEIKLIE